MYKLMTKKYTNKHLKLANISGEYQKYVLVGINLNNYIQ